MSTFGESRLAPIVVDLAELERQPFELRAAGRAATFTLGECPTTIGVGTRGWIRRLAEPDWRQHTTLGTYGGVVRSAWINLLITLAHGFGVEWLTPFDALSLAENKGLQLIEAHRLGLQTPATVIVSGRDKLPDELGDPVIVKPLGPGAYRGDDDTMRVVYAHLVERNSDFLDALGGAPFLVQERLEVEQHLRVVTVSEQTWCCALDATGLPVDWRRDEAAHDAFTLSSGYADVERDALRLARALRAGYSSQDWVVAADSAWFLDFNPGGQWLFLPSPVADEVTDAVATWLDPRR